MKMGDPGYFEREALRDRKTEEYREFAKKCVAHTFAVDKLRKEGVNIPEGMDWTSDSLEYAKRLLKIGKAITENKGLTIDDASPKMKAALVKENKDIRDMYVGSEYFGKELKAQSKRVLDEDVKHIDYSSTSIDVDRIIANIQKRESTNRTVGKGKGIGD